MSEIDCLVASMTVSAANMAEDPPVYRQHTQGRLKPSYFLSTFATNKKTFHRQPGDKISLDLKRKSIDLQNTSSSINVTVSCVNVLCCYLGDEKWHNAD